MESQHVTVVIAVTLLIAGCGQFGGWDSQTPTQLTPVPESNLSGQSSGSDARFSPESLAFAHASALEGANYTVVVRQRVTNPEGEQLRSMVRYREVGRASTTYWGYVRYEFDAPALQEFGTTDYWSNGTHVATKHNPPLRQAQVRLWDSNSDPIDSPSNSARLRTLLEASDPTVRERDDDGTVVLIGTQRYPDVEFETPPALTNLRNLSARFRVRPDGTVARWRITYEASLDGQPVRVVRTGSVEDIGETNIERPAWVANATVVDDQ